MGSNATGPKQRNDIDASLSERIVAQANAAID